ncbi:hypothetical protein CLHOM_34950 [Clostridium homopropionicum DSM 5847]|uniref:DUF1659 domain-containing protein n=1 Tax=Clostridium homopropionicum DSM 5847 TaxID=1121318 RepID=A0A0L6Z5C8_9CLOT|nr:DUF1659 domain-containing protein [Clostridium homopropionicum]KOA18161.1 hypothetical protein CLHOM_34950 [Clostridium homopropionicum DSM 5847]SFG94725.1 Protein of unknown function [Clostridium homopropionicum]
MINSTAMKSTLAIKYVAGQDEGGKDILKTQRLGSVKTAATDENMFLVAAALGSLLLNPSVEVRRENENLIVSE